MKNMIILLYFLTVFLLLACKTEQKPVNKVITKENNTQKVEIKTGWTDPNTYTVMVINGDENNAISKAKHRILKDIVNVRVMNQSRYTDITKIKDEFEKPLEQGRIIHKQSTPDGTQFYFQIRDKGLKQKFERQ